MNRNSYKTFPVYLFIDLIVILFTFSFTYLSRYNSCQSLTEGIKLPNIWGYAVIFLIWQVLIAVFFKIHNLYTTNRLLTIPREILKIAVNLIYASVFIAAAIFFTQYKFFSREIFVINVLMLFVLLSIWRVAKRFIIRKLIIDGYHNINIAIVGLNDTAKFVASEIKKNPHWGFKITGFIDDGDIKDVDGLPVLGKIKDCIKIAKNYFIDELIVTNFANISNLDKLMKEGKNISLGLNLIPENLEGPAILPNISYIGLMPLFSYKERKRYTVDFAAKRLFDFFSALILIILFFPISAIIAVLIKFDSNGTIFYVQKRVGYKGREFNFYKFRSMIMNADKVKAALHEKNEVKDGVIFKIKKDPRTTNIGRFLRKHSMDELPQLINVLKGDISLVGPRPSLPDEVKKYTYDCMQRLSIRPGMTCLSQVRGRSNLSFRKWVKWDLWYINNWSFWLDLKILWWTAGVVLKGKGAY